MSFPQTPGQALPGAFLNTPAVASRFSASGQQDPVRRRLFSQPGPRSGSSATENNPNASFGANGGPIVGQNASDDDTLTRSSQPPPSPLSPLAKAAGFINSALTRDERYPELDSYCRRELTLNLNMTDAAIFQFFLSIG